MAFDFEVDSGTGDSNASAPDFKEYGNASSFNSLWGFLLHNESVTLDQSRLFSTDTASDATVRRRKTTHQLNISGVFIRSGSSPTELLDKKDALSEAFWNDTLGAIQYGIDLFPSLPKTGNSIEPSIYIEPISLNFDEGNYVDQLRYRAVIEYRRFPSSSEIGVISDLITGLEIWDGSTISHRQSYDRKTKKITKTTSISGNIKCPDNMPWSKALEFYNAMIGMEVGGPDDGVQIMEREVSKNDDQQTISYNLTTYELISQGEIAEIEWFGLMWSNLCDITISTEPNPKYTHLYNGCVIQNCSLSLSLSVPDDIPDWTTAQKYYNQAIAMQLGALNITPDGWEIKTASGSFSSGKRTITVNITAVKYLNIPFNLINFAGLSIWEASTYSTQYTSEVDNLLFSEQTNISGQAQVPMDMNESNAIAIVNSINSVGLFTGPYKVLSKQAFYDKFTRQLSYSINLKRLDFYDLFNEGGSFKSHREVSFGHGILSGISGIQSDVTYEQSQSISSEGITVNKLSVTGIIMGDPRINCTNTEACLDAIWNKIHQDTYPTIGGIKYRMESCSRRIDSRRMNGQFTISYSDEGKKNNVTKWYGFILLNCKYEIDHPKVRWQTITDGFTDGVIYQDGGLDVRRITMSATLHRNMFDNLEYIKAEREINDMITATGMVKVKGVEGRVTNFKVSIDELWGTGSLTITIEVQPDVYAGVSEPMSSMPI